MTDRIPSGRDRSGPAVAVSVGSDDRHRWMLPPTGAFVSGAVALRILGLPPLDLHPPLHRVGVMDPLCGGTRGTLALAHGDIAMAWRYNPLVLVVATAAILLAVRYVVGLSTGRWINVDVRWRKSMAAVVAVLTAVLWINQQLHADLLTNDTPHRLTAAGVQSSEL